MAAYTGLKGRGIKKAAFTVINQNTVPAVLCEGGFMDGTNDYKIITSDAGQTAYAKAVAEGIIEFLSLEKKTAEPPVTAPAPTKPTKIDVHIRCGTMSKTHGCQMSKILKIMPEYSS